MFVKSSFEISFSMNQFFLFGLIFAFGASTEEKILACAQNFPFVSFSSRFSLCLSYQLTRFPRNLHMVEDSVEDAFSIFIFFRREEIYLNFVEQQKIS